MVEIMKIMATSFNRSHAHNAALSAAVRAWDLLKEVTIIFNLHHSLFQVKQQGGNTVPRINRKLD